MAFALGIVFAIAALAIAAFAAFTGIEFNSSLPLSQSPIIYGWTAGVIVLLLTAFISRNNAKARFETVVASEVIVVYGITTLVLSIGLGVSRTADVWAAVSGPPPLDQLAPAMRVFAEGFVAAGISPFCAVGLRQLEVLGRGKEEEPVGDVSNELDSFKIALGSAASATMSFATSIKLASESIQQASQRMEASLDAVGASGEGAKAGLDAASAAAASASGRVQPAAEELARLGTAAAEGALLLNGLRDIIASVESFIPKGRNGGAS